MLLSPQNVLEGTCPSGICFNISQCIYFMCNSGTFQTAIHALGLGESAKVYFSFRVFVFYWPSTLLDINPIDSKSQQGCWSFWRRSPRLWGLMWGWNTLFHRECVSGCDIPPTCVSLGWTYGYWLNCIFTPLPVFLSWYVFFFFFLFILV